MSNHDAGRCREIYCKAVVGKGYTQCKNKIEVHPPERISHILGCWVINHSYQCEVHGKRVEVVGSYDVNIWYAFDDNHRTDVIKHHVSFREPLTIHDQGGWRSSSNCEVTVRCQQTPTCLKASLDDDGELIVVKVESEYAADVLAETKVCVKVCADGCGKWEKEDDESAGESFEWAHISDHHG